MSGSFDRPDRPGGRPPYAGQRPRGDYDPYDDPSTAGGETYNTGPPSRQTGYDPVPESGYVEPGFGATGAPNPGTRFDPPVEAPDIYVPARKAGRDQGFAPIVPQGSVTGRSLTLVISIMCFLACLTAGAVYMMQQSAQAWLKDIASEVTVQVEPKEKVDTEKTVQEVAAFLGKQRGIARVKPYSLEQSVALLEPWLGKGEELKALPVPRLIALELEREPTPDLDAIRNGLAQQFKGASLDDHRQWQKQIRTVTRSFALGGLGILVLVAAATMAIIVSATRSAMASNREIVEVLHFVGATDRFIAREFEKHFLRLGVRAGLVGAISALTVFIAMPSVMEFLGGGSVSLTELQRLIGAGSLDLAGCVLMGIVVVVVAALCMLTSRYGVFRILNSRQ